MPARSMSRMRASMSKQPGRISSKRAGSMLHSVAWPPDDGVEPDVGVVPALEDPALGPVVLLDDPRGRRGERGGQAMLEEVRGLNQVVVDRNHRHPDRPGLRIGQQGGAARCGPCVDGSHEKVTLSSANVVRPGGRMTTQIDDVITGVGLLIDGDVVAGAAGTYPVTNPARPAEVVLDAPTATPDQLDQAVAAARRSQPAWAALAPEDRAALVMAAAEAGVAAVERARSGPPAHPRARQDAPGGDLRHRHHGWHGGGLRSVGGRGPGAARASAAGRPGSSGSRTASWPRSCPSTGRCRSWPTRCCPALLAGDTVVVKAPPSCPGTVLLVAAAMAEALPPGVLNVVNGPDAALGAALVGHPDVDMVSFTGGVGTGQAVMAAAAATTRPVVLELGGNDAAILAPDVAGDAALADRIVEAAFVTSGQVCMAVKRLYVHRDRLGRDGGRAGGPAGHRDRGRRSGRGRDHGPGAHGRPHGTGWRPALRGGGGGCRAGAPGPDAARRRGEPAGYFVSPALVVAPPPDAGIVREEQFAPALPVIPYDDMDGGGRGRQRHARSACARRSGATTTRWRPTWPPGSRPGRSSSTPTACRPSTCTRRWAGGSSRASVWSSGTEGMQAFARQRVRVVRPGPAEQGGVEHDSGHPGRDGRRRDGGAAGPGRRAHRRGADRRRRRPGARRRAGADTVIDASGHAGDAGLRGPAHALRRAAVLGPQRRARRRCTA